MFGQPYDSGKYQSPGSNLNPADPNHPYLPQADPDPGSAWLNGAWNTFSGKTAYSTPESVYNPLANYNGAPSQQDRANQNLASQYYGQALNGTQPSLAEQQMKQGIAQGQQQQMAAASGSRGIDRAAAFRQASNSAAQMGAQGAIAGGQQRLQEQQNAASGLANTANQTRQQDIGEQLGLDQAQNQAQQNLNQQYQTDASVQSGNAARQQQAAGNIVSSVGALFASDEDAKENITPMSGGISDTIGSTDDNGDSGGSSFGKAMILAGGHPEMLGKNDQMTPFEKAWETPMNRMGTDSGKNQQTDGVHDLGGFFSSVGSQQQSRAADTPMKIDDGSNSSSGSSGMMGGLGSMVGGMMSDRNSKENLSSLQPYQFDYKTPDAHAMALDAAKHAYEQTFEDAKQPRAGVMAQDLERNPATAPIVERTDGDIRKMLDSKRALGFMLANMGDLNKRLSRLEGGQQ
jgi:hypothetical protein